MFNPDNFYNYLNQYSRSKKLDLDINPFAVHGSRNFSDIAFPHGDNMPDYPEMFIGTAAVFDQEPIELKYFSNWKDYDPKQLEKNFYYRNTKDYLQCLSENDFIFNHFARISNPLLLHSERNSDEVRLLEQNHFHPVHYFYHALIARDWYRHWKHYNTERGYGATRLGLYARDASGSRQYRIELLHRLSEISMSVYYKLQEPIAELEPALSADWPKSKVDYNSDASAMIEISDCQKFDIQIVPETLFNTTKTHLTEKVFKPIVMKQPFIIAGCPNSLEYLKSYGFKTFDALWDERYDKEEDPSKRMDMIMDVVKYLTSTSQQNFDRIMDRAQAIVDFNHKLFFSEEFERDLLLELQNNLNTAIKARDEEDMPGGTHFYYQDLMYKKDKKIPKEFREFNNDLITYLYRTDKDQAEQILLKYKHLFRLKFITGLRL